ncbi:MAG TPA: branched-chain amino acid ABC transporter permease, partial [Anaeromyxobacter sp.]|nr:branched-chain amino acid ABC transporter permease [Anaeromyxobacter sp.]
MRCGDFRETYREDMAIFDSALPRLLLLVFLGALAFAPVVATSFWMDVLNRILIAVIAATGLNILTGFTGQISLGNAAFLAVGAYTTAFLGGRLGLPFPVVIPAAGLLTALIGMIFGIPSLRLKGLYLAVATLAAHFVIEFGISHWESVTGGVNGISIPAAKAGALELKGDKPLFWLLLPLAAVMLLGAKNLFRTKVGKAFVAIRDQDISAEVMGVNVFKYKLLSFAVSSFYVGVAGSLLAYQARIISPENFPITVAIDQLGMIIIGGLGSILGSIFGAIFITLLPELLRLLTGAFAESYPGLVTLFASLKMGIFGLAIVLFLVFEP